MSISQSDAERLMHAGFLPSEIRAIAEAKTANGGDQPPIDTSSPIWQAVMESRSKWWRDKLDREWKETDIIRELENYYKRDERRSPFDFIRAEYRPPTKRKDYLEIVRKRHAAQIMGELEGYKL